jgi:hypothetical protein
MDHLSVEIDLLARIRELEEENDELREQVRELSDLNAQLELGLCRHG